MRDFDWDQPLWAVVNNDGTYAGVPCTSQEEAEEISVYHPGSKVYKLSLTTEALT